MVNLNKSPTFSSADQLRRFLGKPINNWDRSTWSSPILELQDLSSDQITDAFRTGLKLKPGTKKIIISANTEDDLVRILKTLAKHISSGDRTKISIVIQGSLNERGLLEKYRQLVPQITFDKLKTTAVDRTKAVFVTMASPLTWMGNLISKIPGHINLQNLDTNLLHLATGYLSGNHRFYDAQKVDNLTDGGNSEVTEERLDKSNVDIVEGQGTEASPPIVESSHEVIATIGCPPSEDSRTTEENNLNREGESGKLESPSIIKPEPVRLSGVTSEPKMINASQQRLILDDLNKKYADKLRVAKENTDSNYRTLIEKDLQDIFNSCSNMEDYLLAIVARLKELSLIDDAFQLDINSLDNIGFLRLNFHRAKKQPNFRGLSPYLETIWSKTYLDI